MAIDFDAIRKKLNQLSGQNRNLNWRPEVGKEYNIRILAFPNNEGQPFKDRWWYYGIGGENARAFLAPSQFKERDPIQELITKLREDGTPESKEIAKKFYPKMRTYAAIIVRGEEDKGVRLWSFGKMIYQDLLNLMLDEDYGDITDPLTGRDLKITAIKQQGKSFADTKLTPRPNSTPLSKDNNQSKNWLSSIPSIEENIDSYNKISAEEIEKRVNDWLEAGLSSNPEKQSSAEKESSSSEDSSSSDESQSESADDAIAAMRSRGGGAKKKSQSDVDIDSAFSELEDD